MKADRPLILAVLILASGLALICVYCTGNTSMSMAYPMSSSVLQVAVTTSGPAALGGVALTMLGLLLLVWAFLCAIIGETGRMSPAARISRREERVHFKEIDDRTERPVHPTHPTP